MSDIAPISRSTATPPAGAVTRPQVTEAAAPSRGSDRVELSNAAQWLSKLHQLPDIRQDLVDTVREQIQAGTYETDDKINTAVDKLAEELS